MTLDLDAIRKRAEEAERDFPDTRELADDVLALLADNKQLEGIRKDLLAIIRSAEKERDRLAAELLAAQSKVESVGDKLSTALAENAKLRAVAEAAASVVAEDGVRNELLCYNMGLQLMRRLTALDSKGRET